MKISKTTILSLVATTALSATPISVEKIVVNSTAQDDSGLFLGDITNSNKQSFTQKSISTLGTQANMNPYTVIQFSPSVNFTPVDQAGSNEPSFRDPIRIRAKSQSGPGGVYMINGMPISSNPGGGKQMVDMEDVSSIDLHKGYLSVDKNLGFSSLIGKIDMNILAPKQKAGADISQSFGSDSFKRTFLRLDSGKIGDVTLFGSLSSLDSDKNKGAGELGRINGMLGISYKPNETFKADIYAIRNKDEHHNYNSLSYSEATNLGTFFSKDYAMTKPTSANDTNYYDWNRQEFMTTAFLGDIEYKPSTSDTIIVKPYYKKDSGDYWFSNTSKNLVMNWHMDHDLYGAVSSYEHVFSQALKSKIGYWYHKQLPPGPPTDQKKYKVDATSQDYDIAKATSTHDSWASVDAKTFHTFLPSLYMAYDLAQNSSVYLDYSRTYGFDVNLYPTYVSNRATFVGKNVKLQDLWNDLELETSDNIDLGAKTQVGAITLNPSIFTSFVKNKQANIYDSTFGVNYPANVGKAFGYGAEFAASGPINEELEFIVGVSYNKYSFTQDFKSSSTATTSIKGNQLPDAPEIMAKGALSYSLDKWTLTPSARYTSSRYGDVANTQKVDAYTLVDMDVAYKPDEFFGSKNALFRLTATNLTNEKYIATIVSADNVLAADGTSSTYQTGAPSGMYVSLNLKY